MTVAPYPLFIFIALWALTKKSNVPSIVHASWTVLIALTQVPHILDQDVSGVSPWGTTCASITLQYMLYDVMHVTHWTYCIHHGLAILTSGYVLHTGRFSNLVLLVEVNELSTIFMAASYLNFYPDVMRVLFAVSFFWCRIVWLGWILWNKSIGDTFLCTAMSVHYVVNVYWFRRIVQKALRISTSARADQPKILSSAKNNTWRGATRTV